MGIADDFMVSLFAAYPQARDGNLSMEELNKLMYEHQQKINTGSIDDFDGLNPEQMEALLYAPFGPESILQFKKDMDLHVDKVPFFKLSEILINEIQKAGTLKLTANGNLPVRICELLCNQNLIYLPGRHLLKRISEEDIQYLWPLKQYLLDERIVKKRNNVLSLTKNGENFLKEPISVRFIKILNYLVSHFHWCNFYELQDNGRYGQMGWAYSFLLLSRYGDTPRSSNFYSLKLIQAFEMDLWDVQYQQDKGNGAANEFHYAYEVRFFQCFSKWFGLVDIEYKKGHSIFSLNQTIITKSKLFDQLFEVNHKR